MLTGEEDVVLDIFGGSNTTGFAAEALKRKWMTFDLNHEYLVSSVFRFLGGHSSEVVKRVLGELNYSHADFFIGETVCALEPAKKAKSKDESLSQVALVFSGMGDEVANLSEDTQQIVPADAQTAARRGTQSLDEFDRMCGGFR